MHYVSLRIQPRGLGSSQPKSQSGNMLLCVSLWFITPCTALSLPGTGQIRAGNYLKIGFIMREEKKTKTTGGQLENALRFPLKDHKTEDVIGGNLSMRFNMSS